MERTKIDNWHAFLMRVAAAIAQFEGFYTAGSCAQRGNNPGNLRTWGSLPHHVCGTSGYFANFPDAGAGWQALYRQIALNVNRGLTWPEFFAGKPGVYPGYAPAADSNSPMVYASYVAQRVSHNLNEPILSQWH